MGNRRIDSTDDLMRARRNLRLECKRCDRRVIIDAFSLHIWADTHRWPKMLRALVHKLPCEKCRGPVEWSSTEDEATVSFRPMAERKLSWARRLVERYEVLLRKLR